MADDRPLVVLSVLHSLEPGGVERVILRSTDAWRRSGIDARIALGRREGALLDEAPDVPFIVMASDGQVAQRGETLWMMRKLPGVIKSVKPDILLFPSNGMMSVAVVTRLVLGRACPPMILRISNSLHKTEMGRVHRFFHRLSMRLHSHIYSAIVATSEPMRDETIFEMGARPNRVVAIDNSSMTQAFVDRLIALRDTAAPLHPGRHFLAVGRLMPQKNFRLLLDAFARIARPADHLTIVGEGPLREALTQQAEKLGIASRLSLPGHQIDMAPWYAEADAFVLSSDYEGFGNVVAEALAAGLPTVATDCCVAIPMLVENVGRLVPKQDVEALANAMDGICDDPLNLPEMRARGGHFTIEATADRWIALFRRLTQPASHA